MSSTDGSDLSEASARKSELYKCVSAVVLLLNGAWLAQ